MVKTSSYVCLSFIHVLRKKIYVGRFILNCFGTEKENRNGNTEKTPR